MPAQARGCTRIISLIFFVFRKISHPARVCRRLGITCLFLLSLSFAHADDDFSDLATRRGSRPPPAMARLASAVGVWETVSTVRLRPGASPAKTRSTETTRWSPNQRFLITDQLGHLPDGWVNVLVITAYSPDSGYRLMEITPKGNVTKSTMSLEGDTQTILGYREIDGRLIRSELIVKKVSATEVTFRCECTDGGKTWLFSEGISKKRKSE